jgi:hypothetical protein
VTDARWPVASSWGHRAVVVYTSQLSAADGVIHTHLVLGVEVDPGLAVETVFSLYRE